ncbi:MAG: DUF6379 domain-containing protein [Blastocatellia bacterium]
MGPLDKFMLPDNALYASPTGCGLSLRSHWYRSLPLSSIAILTVTIDGADVPAEHLKLAVNGARHPLAALAALHDEWWFIQDAANLTIELPQPLAVDSQHEVTLELGLLLPYILVGPNAEPLLSSSRVTKTLRCHLL